MVAQVNREELRDYAVRVFARDRFKIAVVGESRRRPAGWSIKVFGGLPAKANRADVPHREAAESGPPQSTSTSKYRKRWSASAAPAWRVSIRIFSQRSSSTTSWAPVHFPRGSIKRCVRNAVSLRRLHLALADGARCAVHGLAATRADKTGEAIEIIDTETRHGRQRPDRGRIGESQSLPAGLVCFALRHLDQDRRATGRDSVDDLGIDYIDKRNALVAAVTVEDTKRVAKSLLSGESLTAVVGRPKGVTTTAPRG